ncbi:MAG: 50S ribosomal protein L22 [Candidatus Liptonbacteria bacterium]
MKQQTAQLRHLRMAPRKVRAVADLIRGLSVNEAEAQLMVQRRRPAAALLKLLRSAVSNAKNVKMDSAKLFISEIRVDGATMLHRFLPRARGHADPIQRKSSHVSIVLAEREANKNKFVIAGRKKKKPHAEGDRPKKKRVADKPEEGKEGKKEKERPGFFRKVFSRKAV